MFVIDRYLAIQVKLTKISYIGTLLKGRFIQDSSLYRIPVYSGFGLDRLHCTIRPGNHSLFI